MKKLKILTLILIFALLILEMLPFGAVLTFMDAPKSEVATRYTYSYFDLTPYAYANFGPFITAILSCILLVLAIIALVKKRGKRFVTAQVTISVVALLTSLSPLLYGVSYFTVTAVFISLLTGATALISTLMLAKEE